MDEQNRKRVTIVVPTYNEEENVIPLAEAIGEQMNVLAAYDYEILFIDNASTDATREKIEGLCAADPRVKAIFNLCNFGQFRSPYHGLCAATGDCAILLCADFQDPVALIPKLLAKWEEGNKVVCAVKTRSRENPLKRLARTCYYKLLCAMSAVKQIEHFTGFGLYDRSFIEVLRQRRDPEPYLRGIVAELAPSPALVPYKQERRRAGKSHNRFSTLYDAAMLGFTSYAKAPIRLMMCFGLFFLLASLTGGVFSLVLGLKGQLPTWLLILSAVGFFGALDMIFLSIIGEYALAAARAKRAGEPLVIEERRLNFDGDARE